MPLPELTCAQDFSVCLNHEAFVLDLVTPAGGMYSGAGVLDGMFYPALAGTGMHPINYSYVSPENGCTQSCSFTITVLPLPEMSCGENLEICLNAVPLTLENAMPGGGDYSGTGVEEGVFVPAIAGVGTHTITYFYTGENGCSSTCQFQITVHPVQELSCPEPLGVCIYDDPSTLSLVQPEGGTYEGTGVEGNTFYPDLAGAGIHFITYHFQNEFGCQTSCEFTIEVYPKPVLNCTFPAEICLYDGPLYLEGCTPEGGEYSGNAVAGNTFFPEIAGEGVHEIDYHYTNPSTGCENQTTFEIEVLPAQLVNLPNGWSGISSYMIPKNPEIPEIFASLGNNLVILYNLDGIIYHPGENIVPQELWDSYSGYAIKTTQPATMEFCGDYLQTLTVQLSQGWNLVPMLSKNQVSSEYLFGFNNKVKIVKQVAGWKLYWKEMGINTLGFVKPGEAYYVYCSDETSITFPYYFKDGSEQFSEEKLVISPFKVVNPTPATHILAFADLKTLPFLKGDVVAAFTSSGLCAGQVQVGDENTGLVMYGDDAYTELQDGIFSDEKITYRLYRPGNEQLFGLEFSYDTKFQAGDYFQPEGISVVKEVKMSAVGLETTQAEAVNIFPNPTTGILHITGIEGSYRVEVFNMLEEQVKTLSLDGKSQLDLSEFPNGVYMVKIITGNVFITKKIALQ